MSAPQPAVRPVELADVIGGADPQHLSPALAGVTKIRLVDPEREHANAKRLQRLADEAAAREERRRRWEMRNAEALRAAREDGRHDGYRQGHIAGVQWGMACGAIGAAVFGGLLGVAAVYLRALGVL